MDVKTLIHLTELVRCSSSVSSYPHGASNPAQTRLSHHLFQKICLRFHLSQLGPQFGVFKGKHFQLVLRSVLFALLLLAIPEGCSPVLVLLPLTLLNRIGPSRWSRWLLPLVFLLHSPRLCRDGPEWAG